MLTCPLAPSITGLSAAAAILAVFALHSQPAIANDGCCGVHYRQPIVSACDTPLRWYFIPRRPARPGHDFRYSVEVPDECFTAGPACGACTEQSKAIGDFLLRPGLSDSFMPLEFEQLGKIPNESLLEAMPGQSLGGVK